MSDENFRSRKWQITINNPKDHGFTHENLKSILSEMQKTLYWCMCDEIGEQGTYHTHVYIALSQAIRFNTLKNNFPGAHFVAARGTSQENLDYIKKEGKWAKDKKKETNLPETFEEFGEIPMERPGTRNDLHDLYDMIAAGESNYDITKSNPEYMFNVDKIEKMRQIIKEEAFKDTFRDVQTTYIHGSTNTGKTRSVMDKYGYRNVYRVTDYDHPFDSYKGQDVVLFEEFRSSLKLQDMLNYLDGYPLELPCRYANKIACYTKVYIVTNIPLSEQYKTIQYEHKETFAALLRRIHHVEDFTQKRNGLSPDEDPSEEGFWSSDQEATIN